MELFILVSDCFLVLNFDGDLFARTDIGYRGRKDVRSFLLDEAGPLPFPFGLFVAPSWPRPAP